jgi:hypothetical protein
MTRWHASIEILETVAAIAAKSLRIEASELGLDMSG